MQITRTALLVRRQYPRPRVPTPLEMALSYRVQQAPTLRSPPARRPRTYPQQNLLWWWPLSKVLQDNLDSLGLSAPAYLPPLDLRTWVESDLPRAIVPIV